jgi:hypothetical protein
VSSVELGGRLTVEGPMLRVKSRGSYKKSTVIKKSRASYFSKYFIIFLLSS